VAGVKKWVSEISGIAQTDAASANASNTIAAQLLHNPF
jgi:hypothetical protein